MPKSPQRGHCFNGQRMTLPPLFENNSVLSLITISTNEPTLREWSKRLNSQSNSNSFGIENRFFWEVLFVNASEILRKENESNGLAVFVKTNGVCTCKHQERSM